MRRNQPVLDESPEEEEELPTEGEQSEEDNGAVPSPMDTRDVALRIYRPSIRDYKLKMLIYGPPGVGKTTLAATANMHSLMSEVLFINVEGGLLSVADEVAELGVQVPAVIDLNDWSEFEPVFWYLAKGNHPYQTVVIDNLSELQKKNLDYVVAEAMAAQLRRRKKPGDRQRSGVDDVWLEDHGKNTQQMRRVIRAFRDLPMHVIFTCHDASSQDDQHVETVYPALTPKLRESVLGFMDVVGYMFTEERTDEQTKETTLVRRLLTQPYGKFTAKDRSPGGRLGLVVDEPTAPALINRIIGEER